MAGHHREIGDGPSMVSIVGRVGVAALISALNSWIVFGGQVDRRHVVGFLFGLALAWTAIVDAVMDASERAAITRRRDRLKVIQARLALRRETSTGARGGESLNALRESIGLPRIGGPNTLPGGFKRFVSAVERDRRAMEGDAPATSPKHEWPTDPVYPS